MIGIDPVLDLPLNEGSGTTVYDRSGFNNHGTVYNAVWQKIWRDSVLYFDGTSAYVEVLYSNSLALNTFSVYLWFKPVTNKSVNGLIGTRFGGDCTFDLKTEADGRLHGDIGNGNAWLSTGLDYALGVQPNVWYNVVYVLQPNRCDIHANGQLKTTINFNGTPLLMKSGETLRIGESASNEFGNHVIGEARILRKPLASEQIQVLYNLFRGELRKPPSL